MDDALSPEKNSSNDMWTILLDIQSKVGKILAENVALRKDIDELKRSLDFSNKNIDTLTTTAATLQAQSNDLQKKVHAQETYIEQLEENLDTLEFEHDALEQYTRKYNIEVHGVPERSDENLEELITSIADKLGASVTAEDLDIVHRMYAKPPRVKPIIIRFKSYGKKSEFYQARFQLRNTDLSAIIPGQNGNTSIFINENLTTRRRELFGKVWKLKKDKNFHRVWTVDGKIFLRKTAGGRSFKINNEDDLAKFL